jgi:hypothetical protein
VWLGSSWSDNDIKEQVMSLECSAVLCAKVWPSSQVHEVMDENLLSSWLDPPAFLIGSITAL